MIKPFDPQLVTQRKQGGQVLDYVEWYHYVLRAKAEWPSGFSSDIKMLQTEGDYLYVVVEVTNNDTGEVHSQLGLAQVDKSKVTGFGGAGPEAYSQALRRAFAMHGIGLELYLSDPERTYWGMENPTVPEDPHAITDRQAEVLKVLGELLKQKAEDLYDKKLADKVTGWRRTLSNNRTKEQAGIVIRAMRGELAMMNVNDPTKPLEGPSES